MPKGSPHSRECAQRCRSAESWLVRAPSTSRISAERCAFYAFAIGVLLFGASAVEDYVCLARRSSGQACGVLPASLFYVGIGLALLLLIGSAVQWLRVDRSQRERAGRTIDD
jgi:hypothetical protein